MSVLKIFKSKYFLIALALAPHAKAVPVQVDLLGTVSNAYILDVVDGVQNQYDANAWSIGDALSIGSVLDFKFSFDTESPSIWSATDDIGSTNAYDGNGFELKNDAFQVASSDNVVGVMDNIFDGSDEIYSSIRVPQNTGLKISYQNELYYLVGASINIMDETGKALNNSELSFNQSGLDAFWLNKPEDAYWDHLGMFDLRFLKDPVLNPANDNWPTGGALSVVGFFDGAKITVADVPEPSGIILVMMGLIVFLVRHNRK